MFVGGVRSFKDVHTNYVHAYTDMHFDTYLHYQCMENIHTFRIVKAFMRYVARRIKRNLFVVANKRANLKLEGQLKYFTRYVLFSNLCIFWTNKNEINFSFCISHTERTKIINRCNILSHPSSCMLVNHGPSKQSSPPKKNISHGNEGDSARY